MARRNSTDRTILELIMLAIALIGAATKFFIEVNKHGLWKECILSVGFVGGLNYFLYYLGSTKVLPYSVFAWSCVISFIAFCVYWSHLFNNSTCRQFSKNQLKRNSGYWSEQAWWWNLDGWQFEEEVAKIFILNGYEATVTKGSGDGGVDIIIEKEGYRGIIQCKHYKNPVPPEPIRALWGCKDDFQADEVILIASSGITQAGAEFVSNKPSFRVLNLDDIIRMSEQTRYIEPKKNNTVNNYEKDTNKKEEPQEDKSVIYKPQSRTGRKIDV